jgi:dienelactone hydrolase
MGSSTPVIATGRNVLAAVAALGLALALGPAGALAQGTTEKLSFSREHRGKRVTITGTLHLPAGTGKVPAIIIHHGSGGVSADREGRYARELLELGVAPLVLDSFAARGVSNTVSDQAAVTSLEMLGDAFAALKAVANHARIDAGRIGIIGFSKGGSVALLAAHERHAARALPQGLRFALHVPVYPACNSHYLKPKTTPAPVYLLLGGADTYAGVGPCQEYAAALQAQGARVEVVVYPEAAHGFDGTRGYNIPQGENYSRCIFVEQPDGRWKERTSGLTTNDSTGKRIEAAYKQALARCRTLGVSGGPNAAAKAKSMTDLKSYVQRHLLEGK